MRRKHAVHQSPQTTVHLASAPLEGTRFGAAGQQVEGGYIWSLSWERTQCLCLMGRCISWSIEDRGTRQPVYLFRSQPSAIASRFSFLVSRYFTPCHSRSYATPSSLETCAVSDRLLPGSLLAADGNMFFLHLQHRSVGSPDQETNISVSHPNLRRVPRGVGHILLISARYGESPACTGSCNRVCGG